MTPTEFRSLQSNLGGGMQTPLMALNPKTGQWENVYQTQEMGENGMMADTGYYFQSDPSRPSNASSSYAGGYSSDNGGGLLDSLGALGTLGLGSIGFGVGGLSGASAATGNGITPQTVALDAAGLAGGYGLAGAGLGTAAPAAGATEAGSAGGGTLLADATGVTDAPIAWDAAAAAAPAPAPAAMAGGATDLGGGLYVDEFGNVTGGLFAGGPGTAGAADFAAPASLGEQIIGGAKSLASLVPSSVTNGLTLKYLLDKLGRAAPAVAGAVGSHDMAQAYQDLGQKYLDIGQPSRARYEASFAPGFSMANDPGYADALAQTTKESLHQLSPNAGNPAMSPNAWEQTLKDVNAKFAYPALQNYRNGNASAGGLAALTAAAPGAESNAITAQGNVINSLGAGAADVFNPPKSLADILREMKQAGY